MPNNPLDLTRAGVTAELHIMPGAYHGYSMAIGAPQVSQLVELQSKAMARALGGRSCAN